MTDKPREPRFRILVAAVLTAAIGGMFLSGEFRNQAGAPLSTAVDQRVAQEAPPVAAAPAPDEILTYTGRDPFARDQEEKKAAQKPPAADPLTPAAPSVTPLTPGAGVTVSAGNAASPVSGVGSTRTSPVGGRNDDDPDPGDVIRRVPQPDEPNVVEPVPVDPVAVDDGGYAGSPVPDGSVEGDGKQGNGKGKPSKPKHGGAPPYQAYERAKEKPWKDRGHKGQSARPGRRVGQSRSGWRGNGHGWGWKARCDESHPSSNGHCRR
ncbi:MAG TPA: hypothetical protein VHH54_07065 [Actinomycetota bacterium]|nr:hypothetical protein [Actinomycetota bacterium]